MARRKEAAPAADSGPDGRGWAHVTDDGREFVEWCPRMHERTFKPCGKQVRHAYHDPARRAYVRRYMRAVDGTPPGRGA